MTKKFFKVDTYQEAFDVAAAHLLQQMERCQNTTGGCMYNGDSIANMRGRRCAIGALFTDEALIEWGDSIDDIIRLLRFADEDGWDVGDLPVPFLVQLQEIHDLFDPEVWEEQLRIFALRWQLKVKDMS